MSKILDFPRLFFAVSLLALWLFTQLGLFLSRKRPIPEEDRGDLNLVSGASMTLLGLIIGFSFSMAVSRYDQRKNYEEEEANAIGTEYVRAGLLPDAEAASIHHLLTQYLQQRLQFYTLRDPSLLTSVDTETTKLQAEMWSIIQGAAKAQPTGPAMLLVVGGMNDVLNRQGYTQAAWWNRIPSQAWALMMTLAICCSLLLGYGQHRRRGLLPWVLPFLVSIAFFLIADIDSPRRGRILVVPQNLMSLSQSLEAAK